MKIAVTIILVVVLTLPTVFVTGCGEQPQPYSKGDKLETRQHVRYFKDDRTNLCFAEVGGYDNYSFTNVPCENLSNNILTNPSPSLTIIPSGR